MLNKLLGQMPNASEHGIHIDQMLEFVHWKVLILLVGWSLFLVYVLFRFHKSRNPRANYYGAKTKITTHLEVSVVIVEAVLLIGFAFPLWAKRVNEFPVEQAERVQVFAQQFNFVFHYAGADKKFGPRRIELVDASNPIGLDRSVPDGVDDLVTTNEMHSPVNKPVILEIHAKDVIHNVSIQAMRVGQDAIPGQMIPVWFTPMKTGDYEIICGQLCGLGHYAMRGLLTVDTEEDYGKWQESMAALIPKPAPQGETVASPSEPPDVGQPAEGGGTTVLPSEQPAGSQQSQPLPPANRDAAATSAQSPGASPSPAAKPAASPAATAAPVATPGTAFLGTDLPKRWEIAFQ